jgi:hypothetical protein
MASLVADPYAADDVVNVQIVGARIIEPKFDGDKIVGGRIVDGRVIDPGKSAERDPRRARRVNRENAHSEIVAGLILGLTIVVFYLLR